MKHFNYIIFILIASFININTYSQEFKVKRIQIGDSSKPENAEVILVLETRFQHYNEYPDNENDVFDKTINSPKSARIHKTKNKLYINSLEGFSTSVYDLNERKRLKTIYHKFSEKNSFLFQDTTLFDYKFFTKEKDFNIFSGKPVESCFSHDGRYIWIPYYRRSFDRNAIDISAVAIIDTDTDTIVRVMPTAPLPKMIACSNDNKFIAVTHWGDNTIGMIDITSNDVSEFKYVKHFEVVKRLKLNYDQNMKVDRDHGCGFCLRGTVFSPDSKYLFVGRMGGGGIAVFDIEKMKYLGSVFGMQPNIRHIEISNNSIYIGTNVSGYVQKANMDSIITFVKTNPDKSFDKWKSCYLGKGVRTIVISNDGKYIFAAVNNESKVCVINAETMEKISEINVDSFPVGMDINNNDDTLVVTSQGKSKYGGGNSVMIFKIVKHASGDL